MYIEATDQKTLKNSSEYILYIYKPEQFWSKYYVNLVSHNVVFDKLINTFAQDAFEKKKTILCFNFAENLE